MSLTLPKNPAAATVHRPSGAIHTCDQHTTFIVQWCNGMGFKPMVTPPPFGVVCAICKEIELAEKFNV